MIVLHITVTRTQCLKLLFCYVELLLERNLLDEVHITDKFVHPNDTLWLGRQNIMKDPRVKKEHPEYTENDTVIYCEDTIVFIDVQRFEQFTRKKNVSAHVINGNLNCIINQRQYGFISSDLFTDDVCRMLSYSSSAATELHNVFLDHTFEYLKAAETAPFSRGAGSHFYMENSVIHDMSMVVVNLYTVQQIGDGLDDDKLLLRYTLLKDTYVDMLRNGSSDCKAD